jgi:Relaxase/Mobilisation nuclease domain
MSKRVIDSGPGRPLLDIASYARRGPGHRDRLSLEEIQLISRTVRRAPEVMVKVLSRGGQDMKAVGKHFTYLSRKGDLPIETDDGQEVRGKRAEANLIKDWDLDIQEQRPTSALGARADHKAPKLVHKLMFSMPPGTPPTKVLAAVKVFAREEFGLKHRYAMVLHSDEPHPHVHMVVKAVSEEGVRLNIRKSTLRYWRREFARRLREQGVEANATERAVRGNTMTSQRDGIFRSSQRGMSRYLHKRVLAVSADREFGHVARGRETMARTRAGVEHGWLAAAEILARQGESHLAQETRQFVPRLQVLRTDQDRLTERMKQPSPTKDEPPTR